jgi:hypothetical protein
VAVRERELRQVALHANAAQDRCDWAEHVAERAMREGLAACDEARDLVRRERNVNWLYQQGQVAAYALAQTIRAEARRWKGQAVGWRERWAATRAYATREERRAEALVAALRSTLALLPPCESPACPRPATRYSPGVDALRCDDHGAELDELTCAAEIRAALAALGVTA